MQPEDTFNEVLWGTKKEYAENLFEAYQCGLEDAYIAFTRANLLKPSHVAHAAMLLEICAEQIRHVVTLRQGQMREGVDL